jgi:hypothetical protein
MDDKTKEKDLENAIKNTYGTDKGSMGMVIR